MDLPEALSRLDNLEAALLAQVQELRTIRAEFQKHAVNGALEPLLGGGNFRYLPTMIDGIFRLLIGGTNVPNVHA